MRSNEFITEIDYTAEAYDLLFTAAEIISNATLVGDIDHQDVFTVVANTEQLYFFKTVNQIDAYVIIETAQTNGYHHIRGLRNLSNKKGYVTALIGFLTHRLQKKLKISAAEQLSPAGFRWLKSFLLARGRGLTVTDQTGTFPDIATVENEWTDQHINFIPGPTEIIIESNMIRKLMSKAEISGRLLMGNSFFIGDQTIL